LIQHTQTLFVGYEIDIFGSDFIPCLGETIERVHHLFSKRRNLVSGWIESYVAFRLAPTFIQIGVHCPEWVNNRKSSNLSISERVGFGSRFGYAAVLFDSDNTDSVVVILQHKPIDSFYCRFSPTGALSVGWTCAAVRSELESSNRILGCDDLVIFIDLF